MRAQQVLLISVDYPPHKDGVSCLSEALVKKICADGYSVCVIGPKAPDAPAYDARQPYEILRSSGYAWGYLRFFPLACCTLMAMLKRRPGIVFAMNIGYGGVLAYALRFFGYRYYLWAYGYEFQKVEKYPWLKRLYQKIYAGAERVFPITRFIAGRLESFGVAPSKMQIVYPGVNTDFFRPAHVPISKPGQAGKMILSVSRLVPRKGQDAVLRALPAVLEALPRTLYCIAGEGPCEEALRRLARELGVEKNVSFLGKVGDEALRDLYRQCDVFAMPSKECLQSGHVEGFGIVFLEANACGKPVLAGISGGMPEAVEHEKSGLLVDPENTAEVAKALLRLLQEPGLAEAMGAYGRERAVSRFDWRNTLKDITLHEPAVRY